MAAMIDGLVNWLRRAEDIVLLGHISPDGDAAGSVMALKMALEAMGKRAAAYLPGGLPRMYAFLPGAEKFCGKAEEISFVPKAALAVDVSEFFRLGEGGDMFSAAPARAVLDHHGTNDGFGQINCIDGGRTATGELALEVILALGCKLTPDMAAWLYTAICTDSGQFGYNNTTGDAMRAAAICMDAGADSANITRMLYRNRTQARTKLLGLVLSGLAVECDGSIAYARLTADMLRRADARQEDSEGIVNYLNEIEGVRIAILAEERGEATKFSLRSARELNVAQAVAAPLGGGGHANAAGLTLNIPLEQALEAVLARARMAVAE